MDTNRNHEHVLDESFCCIEDWHLSLLTQIVDKITKDAPDIRLMLKLDTGYPSEF
jgi:hypothetical protein